MRVQQDKRNAKQIYAIGRARRAFGLLMVAALAVFTVSALRATYRPQRLYASADTHPPTVRSKARVPPPPVETEAQPAGVARRARIAQAEAEAKGPVPTPHLAPPVVRAAGKPVALVGPARERPAPRPSRIADARAAIIIDDCGNNNVPTEMFVNAPAPVTLSILPYLAFSKSIAHAATEKGKGVMLHFPMEASGGQDPGPGTLRVAMSDEQKMKIIHDNLESVPDLQGVNNHEGSLATTDPHSMDMVLRAVRQKGLFFVDSVTTPDSCLPDIAEQVGVPFAKRDLFLDNVDEIEAIKEQMRNLIREALAHGHAIGIGHARTTTATAFLEMIPAFEEAGVRLVLVRELTQVETHTTSAPATAHPVKEGKR